MVNLQMASHKQAQQLKLLYDQGVRGQLTKNTLSEYIIIIICFFICVHYVTFAVASVKIYYLSDLFDGIN